MLLKFANETEWLMTKKKDVTSTDVASLFGLNPYKSRLRLWHEKAGNVEPEFVDSPFAKWGRRLQIPVAMGICEDEGWQGEDLSLFYARDPALRLGASFDVKAYYDFNAARMLEVKVAEAFREEDGWTKNAAPMPYEFQMQTQLHLSMKEDHDIKSGVIGVLGKRQSTRLYHREYDAGVGAMIEEETHEFWRTINENTPPDPDYLIDSEILKRLRGPIRHGDIINLSNNDAAKMALHRLKAAKEALKPLKKEIRIHEDQADAAKEEIRQLVGRNEIAIIGDYQISTAQQEQEDKVIYGSSFRRFDMKKRKK